MRSQKAIWTACALALAIYVSRGNSQTLQPPETTLDALHAMSQQAAIVFAGQVIAVRQSDGHSRATRFVEIDFAIDDAIRGVSGGIYTLREWAGLWQAGGALIPGQRYLMLLHAPGPSGLSSPVGGMDGAIPIRGTAQPPQALSRESETTDTREVDLRWIGTRVARPVSYRPESVARPPLVPVAVRAYTVTRSSSIAPEAPSPNPDESAAPMALAATAEPTPPSASYTATIGLLRAWEKSDHGTR
ncbi:MAG TPA: hypothetical protein VF865_20180 [Acidobacteriaceae bacterium]